MIIKQEMLEYMQYFNKKNKRLKYTGVVSPKKATMYHVFSTDLVEKVYSRNKADGTFKNIATGTSGWSEDIVLAIYNNTEFSLKESIIIAARSCERCINALAFEYKLGNGYPKYSKEWHNCNTSCLFCSEDQK